MKARSIVYGLVDPRTLLVRYVGFSSSGLRRPETHRRACETSKHTHKASWVKSLLATGLDYTIVVLEEASAKEALPDLERWWIAFGRACGWPLTNHTDGGEGAPGNKPSLETRRKMGAARRGVPLSAETRLRMKVAAKTRAPVYGRPCTPETRAKIAARKIGVPREPATTEKMAAKMRTPEMRALLSRARKGKPLSLEHRAKLSAARRAYLTKKRAQ